MKNFLFVLPLATLCAAFAGCGSGTPRHNPRSISGVEEARAEVKTGADGLTSEQRNVKERLKRDNKPGYVKHLYVFSAYSGQCLLYSTVREKVTSSGKRLSPTSVLAAEGQNSRSGVPVTVNGSTHLTGELIQDDGTYGHSIEYLFWFDENDRYMQMYVTGGMFPVLSDEPLPVKSVTMRVEASGKK